MRFEIVEIDRDYNAYVGSEFIEFESQEDADAYCKDRTWSGVSYYADKIQ
jgi:hypothetical protein